MYKPAMYILLAGGMQLEVITISEVDRRGERSCMSHHVCMYICTLYSKYVYMDTGFLPSSQEIIFT